MQNKLRKLTSASRYYFNYVVIVILSLVLISVGINSVVSERRSDNWPYFIVFIIIGLLLLYSLINFRIVEFDSENVYISGWLASAAFPIKNISGIEASPFMIKPPISSSNATYSVRYLTENGKIKKFYFLLDTAFSRNNWQQFKSQLPFKFEES